LVISLPRVQSYHGRPQGGKTGICAPLEIGTKKKNSENMKSAAQCQLIGLILAMTVYFPVGHTLHKSQVHGPGVMQ